MNEFLENLKKQVAENPMVALGVGAAFLTALSKFVNAGTESRNARAWDREVKRREKKDRMSKK